MNKRALISVSNKDNVVEFAKELVKLNFEIISTGGTKKALQDAGIKAIDIGNITNFPEMLDGRVKTLHPMVHGGLLAVRDDACHQAQVSEYGIGYIDLVCVNLYPFSETVARDGFTHEDAIENIDIGGPSMIRSSAKNYTYVTVVTDSNDYPTILEELMLHGDTTLETRAKLAAKAFRLTASYDAVIQEYLTSYVKEENPEKLILSYDYKQTLRYGENAHQEAKFYTDGTSNVYGISDAKQIHGKELSYINIQDSQAALQIVNEFKETKAVVAVKHSNPCGVGVSDNIETAYDRAYAADPVSIFGGIVAFNDEVNASIATKLSKIFLEIILAPSFTKEALDILTAKKNLRIMTYSLQKEEAKMQYVSVGSGLLTQDVDNKTSTIDNCKIVTIKQPTKSEIQDCLFGEKIVKHVKSNAIVVVKDGMSIGVGAGQMNRVGAAKIALEQAGDAANGAILASDAFFPMNDTVALAAAYGITAIIQPGGSIKDQDSIDMANEKNMAMIFTGERHFKH